MPALVHRSPGLTRTLAVGAAAALGFGLNLLPLPLFFGLDVLVGGLFATIIGLIYGPVFGAAVALIVYSPTLHHWAHPWGILSLTLQTVWLSVWYGRNKGWLLELDFLYWAVLGAPLIALCYGGLMDLPLIDVAVVVLKQTLNSLALTAAAGLLVGLWGGRLSRRWGAQPISAYYTQLLLLVLAVPLVVLLVVMGRYTYRETWSAEVHEAVHTAQDIASRVQHWVDRYQNTAAQTAGQISLGLSRQGQIQVLLEGAVKGNPGLLNAYVADKHGTTTAFYPRANPAGGNLVGLNFSDRPYFVRLKETLQPGLSDVFLGRAGVEGPVVVATQPLLTPAGDFDGLVLVAIDPGTILGPGHYHWDADGDHILVDGVGRVVAATSDFTALDLFDLARHRPGATAVAVSDRVTHVLAQSSVPLQQWERSELWVHTPIAGTNWTLYSSHRITSLKVELFSRYAWLMGIVLLVAVVSAPLLRLCSGFLFRPIEQLAGLNMIGPGPGNTLLYSSFRNSSIREVRSLYAQFRRGAAKLAHMAYHDPLTGLPNRAALGRRLDEILNARQPRRPTALIYLDLDGFKVINDSLGHEVGDQLLKRVSQRLRQAVPGAMVCRLGGDEFTVVLEDTDSSAAVAAAERILAALDQAFEVSRGQVVVTASIGVVPGDQVASANEYLRCADMAMYEAKRNGKRAYAVYDDSMNERACRRLDLEMELRNALRQGEFRLVYQPVVTLADRRAVCMEALIRWHHPVRGIVSPAEFIPVAEETGLILPIDRWVLEQACRQGQAWLASAPGEAPVRMAVNLSARQFHSPTLVEDVAAVLALTGFPARLLELEITESAVMQDVQATARTMRELKALGVSLAIDDFGTGYSSLSYLKFFPLDTLKIDRTFVRDVAADPDAQAIVAAMVNMAGILGLQTVAEGIETGEQLQQLQKLGVAVGQGFLIARPADPDTAWASVGRRSL